MKRQKQESGVRPITAKKLKIPKHVPSMVYDLDNPNEVVAGIDEVGRGPLAFRTYAAAVILPKNFTYPDDMIIRDSKKIKNIKARERAAAYIKAHALDWAIAWREVDQIDGTRNISTSIQSCFHQCLDNLSEPFNLIIADGTDFHPFMNKETGESYNCVALPKADDNYMAVAAASILAKVERDNHVLEMVSRYPRLQVFGFLTNMGYGTEEHIKALEEYGYTEFHRTHFKMKEGNIKIPISEKYQFYPVMDYPSL